MNAFTSALGRKNTYTENGALSNSTSGSSVLDYFGNAGSYRGRDEVAVASDMASIFSEDQELALKVLFYNRMVTRQVKGFETTEKVQKGQGQKDEFVKSLKWLENNYPYLLYKNLWLVPTVGSWKDLWYDSPATGFHYYVNPEQVYALVARGLKNPYHRALLAKYLPKIRSRSNVKNDRQRRLNEWAKGLIRYLGWTEKQYRQFKSNPENNAHLFQRLMASQKWDDIDFNMIPGKALFKMLSSKGRDSQSVLERHNLEKAFEKWIKSQKTAKFTGYVYELYKAARSRTNVLQKYTFDAQFDGLIELAKKDVDNKLLEKGVLCALDTSGSMSISVDSNGTQAVDVCVSLGIYFSSLLKGHFADHVIMFDSNSKLVKLSGKFTDKVDQINSLATAWGSTNFQSVIDEIVRVRRQNPSIPVEDYPQVLLVVSDMQFNPYGGWTSPLESKVRTNYDEAMRKLQAVGLPKMTVIWWQVNGTRVKDVPSTIDDEGTVLVSGFDPAVVTVLLGGEDEVKDEKTGEVRKLNPYEQMVKALDQEILNRVAV